MCQRPQYKTGLLDMIGKKVWNDIGWNSKSESTIVQILKITMHKILWSLNGSMQHGTPQLDQSGSL